MLLVHGFAWFVDCADENAKWFVRPGDNHPATRRHAQRWLSPHLVNKGDMGNDGCRLTLLNRGDMQGGPHQQGRQRKECFSVGRKCVGRLLPRAL